MIVALLAGCVDGGGAGGDAGPPVFEGTYAVASTWDLSQPFGGDGLAGALADQMIEQVVALAGVPSQLEDDAIALVAGEVRAPLVAYIDARLPEELVPGGPTMTALDAILSNVAAEGTFVLAPATGTETVTGIAVTHAGARIEIAMSELLDGAVSVAGDFAIDVTGAATLALGDHALEIRAGALVAIAAREALGVDAYALADEAMAALSCAALVDEITTADTYGISVGGQSFEVTAASLEGGCDDLRAELADDALGLVRPDAGITLGGPARVAGSAVVSEAGYGGVITAAPGPLAPAVIASFTATK